MPEGVQKSIPAALVVLIAHIIVGMDRGVHGEQDAVASFIEGDGVDLLGVDSAIWVCEPARVNDALRSVDLSEGPALSVWLVARRSKCDVPGATHAKVGSCIRDDPVSLGRVPDPPRQGVDPGIEGGDLIRIENDFDMDVGCHAASRSRPEVCA
jgi:hypothetical protein